MLINPPSQAATNSHPISIMPYSPSGREQAIRTSLGIENPGALADVLHFLRAFYAPLANAQSDMGTNAKTISLRQRFIRQVRAQCLIEVPHMPEVVLAHSRAQNRGVVNAARIAKSAIDLLWLAREYDESWRTVPVSLDYVPIIPVVPEEPPRPRKVAKRPPPPEPVFFRGGPFRPIAPAPPGVIEPAPAPAPVPVLSPVPRGPVRPPPGAINPVRAPVPVLAPVPAPVLVPALPTSPTEAVPLPLNPEQVSESENERKRKSEAAEISEAASPAHKKRAVSEEKVTTAKKLPERQRESNSLTPAPSPLPNPQAIPLNSQGQSIANNPGEESDQPSIKASSPQVEAGREVQVQPQAQAVEADVEQGFQSETSESENEFADNQNEAKQLMDAIVDDRVLDADNDTPMPDADDLNDAAPSIKGWGFKGWGFL